MSFKCTVQGTRLLMAQQDIYSRAAKASFSTEASSAESTPTGSWFNSVWFFPPNRVGYEGLTGLWMFCFVDCRICEGALW